jgi:uncharacterized protein (TIGR02147 family)
MSVASIYSFVDYREYLKQELSERKAKNPGFSFRAAAMKLGINSGTLVRILNGKRNLSKNVLPKFVNFLKLKSREAEYFGLLVGFDRSSTVEKRQKTYEEIVRLRGERKRTVGMDKYEFYRQWYFTAVREMLRLKRAPKTFDAVAAHLLPPVSPRQAAVAMETLERLGFIRRKTDGTMQVAEQLITTGEKWQGAAIHDFQAGMIHKALEAMEWFPKQDRDISTVTVGLSDQGLDRTREVLGRARQEILDIEETDKKADRVFQLNIQLFPLSKRLNGGSA